MRPAPSPRLPARSRRLPRTRRARAPRRAAGAGGVLDRLDDVVIARAAAEVAREPLADLALGRVGVALEQVGRGHDHARRAVAALQAVLRVEALLERVQVGPCRPCPRSCARSAPSAWTARIVQLFTDSPSRWTVQAPQLDVSQPDVRARQPEGVAQEVHQQQPRLHLRRMQLAVDGHGDTDGVCHVRPLLSPWMDWAAGDYAPGCGVPTAPVRNSAELDRGGGDRRPSSRP